MKKLKEIHKIYELFVSIWLEEVPVSHFHNVMANEFMMYGTTLREKIFDVPYLSRMAKAGLSLSYDIVRAHGGEIDVNTVKDAGTEFTIKLPLNE